MSGTAKLSLRRASASPPLDVPFQVIWDNLTPHGRETLGRFLHDTYGWTPKQKGEGMNMSQLAALVGGGSMDLEQLAARLREIIQAHPEVGRQLFKQRAPARPIAAELHRAVRDTLGREPVGKMEEIRIKKQILDGTPGSLAALCLEERRAKLGLS